MNRADFRVFDRLRVRWAEIDAQNIVFNGHYLMYFDTAVAAYWRALAMPYAQTMQRLGGDLYVRKATLTYEASARYDDLLDVGMRCARIGTSSMTFEGMVFRQDRPLVGCELVYVFADPQSQTSRPVPAALRGALEGFERGEAMTQVTVGCWQDLGAQARAVRTEVFVDEQGIAASLEWDEADESAVHAVACNRFGQTLATGRLLAADAGVARIGRMACVQAVRGSGLGRQVLQALTEVARTRGDRVLTLHAQLGARGFYEREGYRAQGDVFEEAGIPHIDMTRAL